MVKETIIRKIECEHNECQGELEKIAATPVYNRYGSDVKKREEYYMCKSCGTCYKRHGQFDKHSRIWEYGTYDLCYETKELIKKVEELRMEWQPDDEE